MLRLRLYIYLSTILYFSKNRLLRIHTASRMKKIKRNVSLIFFLIGKYITLNRSKTRFEKTKQKVTKLYIPRYANPCH